MVWTFLWGLRPKPAVFSESACAFGIVSKSEKNHVKLTWNVSCALIPVQGNPMEIRCFNHLVFCLWSFSEIRVALPWGGMMPWSHWTGSLCPWGGGARAHTTKKIIIIEIKLLDCNLTNNREGIDTCGWLNEWKWEWFMKKGKWEIGKFGALEIFGSFVLHTLRISTSWWPSVAYS